MGEPPPLPTVNGSPGRHQQHFPTRNDATKKCWCWISFPWVSKPSIKFRTFMGPSWYPKMMSFGSSQIRNFTWKININQIRSYSNIFSVAFLFENGCLMLPVRQNGRVFALFASRRVVPCNCFGRGGPREWQGCLASKEAMGESRRMGIRKNKI